MNITGLVQEIVRRCDEDGNWEMGIEEVIWLTGAETTEFYRVLYSLKEKLHFSGALKGFSQETVGELLTLLEELSGEELEEPFVRQGLHLPYKERVELTEAFLFVVNRALAAHSLNYEELEGMMYHKKDLRTAFQLYIREYFSREELMEEGVQEYLSHISPGPHTKSTAFRYLETLFRMNILDWEKLLLSLYLKIRHIFCPPEEEFPEGDPEEKSRLSEAAELLDIHPLELTKEKLKQQYKKMMKIYHPDINPQGLEMSKRINTAYGYLLSLTTS